jgi:serine protease inhibitor
MKYPYGSLLALSAMLAVAFVNISCAATGGPAPDHKGSAAGGYSSFGIDLYRELLKEKPGANIFMSPASIGLALAMTYNGSSGATRDAMAKVLRFSDGGLESVNADDSALIRQMNDTIAEVVLSIANSLWARQGLTFDKSFLERNERCYGAEIRTLDFSNPGAAGKINAWVAEKTNDRIPSIVDQIDGGAILFLINAIYFKGTWMNEFDKALTRDDTFHVADGGEKLQPMMMQSGKYDYLDGGEFQAARLPYGDGRIGMYVFLPASGSSLQRFHGELSSDGWKAWMQRFVPRRGRIVLPRFRLEYKANLKRELSALGMGVAFDGSRADFTGMIQAPGANAFIHDVVHKAFIEVNEEGTEAAAATSVEIRLTSIMEPEEPFEMKVDRPFFFAIVDGETGLILFMGSIVNPQ